MSILQRFQRIQKIFYLAGLAPCCFGVENAKHKSCFRRVPIIISFLTSVCVASLQFCIFYLDSFGTISRLVNYALFSVILCSNVTANWQCWYYESTYYNLIRRVQLLENACKLKFSMKISYGTVKRRYMVNVVSIIGFYSISAAAVLGQAWFIGDYPKISILLALGTTLKELMCAMAVLHFTLYVDVVRSFVAELNKQRRWSPIYFYKSTQVAFLKDVKLVHMDLFVVMKQINRFYGWHLLVLMAHYLVLLTYSFYWFFLTLHREGKFYSITESVFTFIYCSFSMRVLINSGEYCAIETMHLMENVERYGFYAFDQAELYEIKNELFQQIKNFRLDVTAKGYFTFNRRLSTSITSSCCTYLIILIQFSLSSEHIDRGLYNVTKPMNCSIDVMNLTNSQSNQLI